jgi:hypothetical protein
MQKYKKYFEKMISENKDVFDSFAKVHMQYSIDPNLNQVKFNEEGAKVLEIVRSYEDRLCKDMERGKYNVYSGRLAEKFQQIVKQHFPLIDCVGLVAEEPDNQESFSIKRIRL